MLTPSATELCEALTTLMPLAPISAEPDRLTVPELLLVTVDLFAAMDPPVVGLVAPAVTLSIWASVMGFALLVLLVCA